MSGTNDNLPEELQDHIQLRVNDDGTKTVFLTEPVEYANGEITEVTFRKPKGRDWRETDKVKGDVAKSFALAGVLADLPSKVFDRMEGEDALLCAAVAATMGKK
jgi:hypothetical protein